MEEFRKPQVKNEGIWTQLQTAHITCRDGERNANKIWVRKHE
jgi:hypothetical protein